MEFDTDSNNPLQKGQIFKLSYNEWIKYAYRCHIEFLKKIILTIIFYNIIKHLFIHCIIIIMSISQTVLVYCIGQCLQSNNHFQQHVFDIKQLVEIQLNCIMFLICSDFTSYWYDINRQGGQQRICAIMWYNKGCSHVRNGNVSFSGCNLSNLKFFLCNAKRHRNILKRLITYFCLAIS